ncbi:MAG: efflux RND transporter periplasmic adaptor subunit [Lachnospiraceae bacterium]|nr:efflux RND transporter periplasmic adaptor subunit [Lachnospiraceae bacterium]
MEFLKNKKKVSVIAILCAAALAVGGMSMHANAAMKVKTYVAGKGNIEKIIEVNGNVVSNETASYYSKINGKIAKINYKVGDVVKKGDVIVSYDTDEIERMIALTDYSYQEAIGNYDSIIQAGGRSAGLYSEAKTTLADLDNKIALTQQVIDITKNNLIEKKAALANEGANLQISVIDWADQPNSEEYENLQKEIASNAVAQQFAPEIVSMQENLDALTEQLTSYKELKSQMISQKATGYAGLLTEGTKEQVEAAKASNEISTQNTIDRYEEALGGIKAEFNGVITSIGVSENETVGDGSFLFTIESSEDVVVKVNVNKYDIVDMEEGQQAVASIKNKDYTGKVTRIEHMTGQGESANVGVEISLDQPDDSIILGLETKAKVTTASLENEITIPLDALGMDAEGNYVFVLNDKKAQLRRIEVGIKNDDYAQVVSGIDENEIIIWNDEAELSDGMDVRCE